MFLKLQNSFLTVVLLQSLIVQSQSSGPKIADGDTITKTLKLGEAHNYQIELNQGELAVLTLYDYTINTKSIVTNEENYIVEQSDTWDISNYIVFYADESGEFGIEIQPFNNSQEEGIYSLKTKIYRSETNDKTETIDQFLSIFYEDDGPGASILILNNGIPKYKRSFGLSNLEYNIPVTENTVFNLASVSKQFTAYGIAILANDGVISLEDNIRKYIPELPKYDHVVTIQHLIDHTSGLHESRHALVLAGYGSEGFYDKDRVLHYLSRQKNLLFTPGERLQYSNSGYMLLSEIITRSTGIEFAEWIKENIFSPLEMNNSIIRDNAELTIEKRAYPYYRLSEEDYALSLNDFGAIGAAGVYTSIEDLVKWLDNYRTGKVGGPGVLNIINKVGVLNNGDRTNYAFGNWKSDNKGLNRINHLGLTSGYRTSVTRYPDKDVAIIYLANDGEFRTYYLARKIEDIFLSDSFSFVKKESEDSKTVDTNEYASSGELEGEKRIDTDITEYLGVYYSNEIVASYDFVEKNGKIQILSTKHNPIDLEQTDNDIFKGNQWFFDQIKFQRDKSNKIIGCIVFSDSYGAGIEFTKE
nr:serine hydrolase domain-containing protein [Allomuricauda sp.]